MGVRCVDMNRKLWTRDGKAALALDLAVMVREGLGLDGVGDPPASDARAGT